MIAGFLFPFVSALLVFQTYARRNVQRLGMQWKQAAVVAAAKFKKLMNIFDECHSKWIIENENRMG